MTISTECRLWGDRLADGIEAKRAMAKYWYRRAQFHVVQRNRVKFKFAWNQMNRLSRQIAAVEAAARKRR